MMRNKTLRSTFFRLMYRASTDTYTVCECLFDYTELKDSPSMQDATKNASHLAIFTQRKQNGGFGIC